MILTLDFNLEDYTGLDWSLKWIDLSFWYLKVVY